MNYLTFQMYLSSFFQMYGRMDELPCSLLSQGAHHPATMWGSSPKAGPVPHVCMATGLTDLFVQWNRKSPEAHRNTCTLFALCCTVKTKGESMGVHSQQVKTGRAQVKGVVLCSAAAAGLPLSTRILNTKQNLRVNVRASF